MWEWTRYETRGSADYVPVSRWGKDHWSTMAYLETCAVDRGGKVENARMRCHARLHRHFVYNPPGGHHLGDGSRYPTRLRDDKVLEKHDDWSCLEDMVAAGLVVAKMRKVNMDTSGDMECRVRFTDSGITLAGLLRRHKLEGGSYGNFQPEDHTQWLVIAGLTAQSA